jgi:FkbM family methyltransferase
MVAALEVLKWIEAQVREHVWLYHHARRLFFVYSWLFRFPHEPEFAVLRHLRGHTGVLLDVGANDGLSILSMRMFDRTNPIVSVEPNPRYRRRLERLCRWFGPASVRNCATGDQPGQFLLHVPAYRGYPLPAFASLDPAEARDLPAHGMFRRRFDPAQVQIESVTVPVEPVDAWRLDPIFVKIDVQGAELATLRGMRATLLRSRPVVLIERNPGTFGEIRRWLEALDYRMVDYRTLAPAPDEASSNSVNAVFWPKNPPPPSPA